MQQQLVGSNNAQHHQEQQQLQAEQDLDNNIDMASRRQPPLTTVAAAVYGIGVDIAHIPRFRQCFARHGDRFLRRALHPSEIAEFYTKPTAAQPGFLASRCAHSLTTLLVCLRGVLA